MKVQLDLVQRNGIRLPAQEADAMASWVGALQLGRRRASPTRTLPALELTTVDTRP